MTDKQTIAATEYADFARRMAPSVREAAVIARRLEGRVPNKPKTDEGTAVKQALTEADTAAQEAVLEALLAAFPGVALAAEEDTPSVAHFAAKGDALVVIDPIDGTLHSYLEGGGPYAVIVGLALFGNLEAALVALPREGLLFHATLGSGAKMLRPGGDPGPACASADGDRILVSHGMPQGVCDYLTGRGFEVILSCGGAVAVAPLIPGVRAGLRLATGEQGVSIRGRVGTLIAREAGATVLRQDSRAFPRDLYTPAPILRIATNDRDLEILNEGLEAAGISYRD